MKRYIALLRGVNISGKNKVPMAQLKEALEAQGFLDVKTWLNSGNLVFSGEEADTAELAGRIGRVIRGGVWPGHPCFRPAAGGAGGHSAPCPGLVGNGE